MVPAVPEGVFRQAVRHFWQVRGLRTSAQIGRGVTDQGSRSAVTGGRQLHGFIDTIARLLLSAGVSERDIHVRETTLPGYFRPTKEWDIVVVAESRLLAAIELKSQVGPSFGNNFNNRTEEALGSSVDLWTAYRESAFETSPQPWLGYLFVLEDCVASQAPVRVKESHFPVFEEYRGASYSIRYETLLRRLVRERHYTSACLLLADPNEVDAVPNYSEPAADLSTAQFLDQLLRHVTPSIP